jgi:hypothetical protein
MVPGPFYMGQKLGMAVNIRAWNAVVLPIYIHPRQVTSALMPTVARTGECSVAVLFLATFPTLIGTFTTGGRMWWSLARDNATPFK